MDIQVMVAEECHKKYAEQIFESRLIDWSSIEIG